MRASEEGHLNVVRELLQDPKICVDAKYNAGQTACYMASVNGHWNIVWELLHHDEVDVNVQGSLGCTTLMWAILQGNLKVVCKLLKHDKVDTSVKNKAGSTALDLARNCDLVDIVECLEEHAKVCLRRREAEESSKRKEAKRKEDV